MHPGLQTGCGEEAGGDLRGHKHTLSAAAAEFPPRQLFEVSLLETAPPSIRFFVFSSFCLSHNGMCQRVGDVAINSNDI